MREALQYTGEIVLNIGIGALAVVAVGIICKGAAMCCARRNK